MGDLELLENMLNEILSARIKLTKEGYEACHPHLIKAGNYLDEIPLKERYKPFFTLYAYAWSWSTGGHCSEEYLKYFQKSKALLQRLETEQMPTKEIIRNEVVTEKKHYNLGEIKEMLKNPDPFDDLKLQKSCDHEFLSQGKGLDFHLLEKVIYLGYKPGVLSFKIKQTNPGLAKRVDSVFENYQKWKKN